MTSDLITAIRQVALDCDWDQFNSPKVLAHTLSI